MDFSQFDSRAAADEGRPLHLKHPVTGKPLYDNADATAPNDKPCRVWVTGSEGREAQKVLREILRSDLKDDDSDDAMKSMEDQHGRLVRLTGPLITKFENVNRGDAPAAAPDDSEWFLNLQLTNGRTDEKSFAEQVAEFSTGRGNYLGNSASAS